MVYHDISTPPVLTALLNCVPKIYRSHKPIQSAMSNDKRDIVVKREAPDNDELKDYPTPSRHVTLQDNRVSDILTAASVFCIDLFFNNIVAGKTVVLASA